MSDIYTEIIIDHNNNPRNFGVLKEFTHHAKLENTSCGDSLEVWLSIDEKDKVKDVKFSGKGCSVSIALMSLVSEEIIGMSIKELTKYDNDNILQELNLKLSSTRKKCASLSVGTLHKALEVENAVN